MKGSKGLLNSKQTQMSSFHEESSFKLVSTLLAKVLGRNNHHIFISAESGNFIYDHAAEVEITEDTHFCVNKASVIEREKVTEIVVDGSVKKRNKKSNSFSIFFTMKRKNLIIPNSNKKRGKTPTRIESTDIVGITGMLYNSIFTLSLNCVDNTGCQYPLGTGRGYLIFDEEQRE